MTTPDNEGEPITEQGLTELKAELGQLETAGRREIAQRILTARGHGDLSENAEYHAAKDDQAHLETKILRLREPPTGPWSSSRARRATPCGWASP